VPCCTVLQVTELWQFFLVRMLTGISVGGCFPLVFSLLGDLFPVSQRAAMSAIVQIAVGGGIGGGQVGSRFCSKDQTAKIKQASVRHYRAVSSGQCNLQG
jgi:MFS family permease